MFKRLRINSCSQQVIFNPVRVKGYLNSPSDGSREDRGYAAREVLNDKQALVKITNTEIPVMLLKHSLFLKCTSMHYMQYSPLSLQEVTYVR